MLTGEKIEKFIDAGYTKQEIDLLFADPKIPPEDPAPEGGSDPGEKEPEKKETAQGPNIVDTVKALTDTVNSLTETVKAIQTANIAGAKTDKPGKDDINDIMKSYAESFVQKS